MHCPLYTWPLVCILRSFWLSDSFFFFPLEGCCSTQSKRREVALPMMNSARWWLFWKLLWIWWNLERRARGFTVLTPWCMDAKFITLPRKIRGWKLGFAWTSVCVMWVIVSARFFFRRANLFTYTALALASKLWLCEVNYIHKIKIDILLAPF